MLPAILASVLCRKSRDRQSSNASSQNEGRLHRRPRLDLIISVLSVLILIVAMVLALLSILAGKSAGFMEEYAIFTLNISRIGENLKDEIDHKIASIDFNIKRSVQMSPAEAPVAMITAPPTTFARIERRFDIPGTEEAGSLLHHGTSDIDHIAHHVSSDARSAVSHATSAAASAIDSGLNAVQSEVIKLVNEAYDGIIDSLDLKAFYSLHMETTCYGHYETSSGQNITVGSDVLPGNGTHKHVDKCEKHSALDPVSWVTDVYWTGFGVIVFVLVLALVNIFFGHGWYAVLSVCITFLAFLIIFLLTAVMHGLAFGASKLINFVGKEIGVSGAVGKWVILSWTVVGLLGAHIIATVVLGFLRHREKKRLEDPRTPTISYPMSEMPNGYHRRSDRI